MSFSVSLYPSHRTPIAARECRVVVNKGEKPAETAVEEFCRMIAPIGQRRGQQPEPGE